MSSFKRKTGTPAVQQAPIGARQSFSTPSVSLISSGIPSLDDLLGGGLPLGSVVAVLTPDLHSAWGTLIQRYFIAQGLAGDQAVCVVRDDAKDLVDGCMWLAGTKGLPVEDGALDHVEEEPDAKIKIAWRYEKMRQFQTTVPATSCMYWYLYYNSPCVLMHAGGSG
jgi:elongator complex protein 4